MRAPQSQSGVGSAARALIGFALLVTAHFGVRPLFGSRVMVDFLVIAALFAAVRIRPGLAALLGFVLGLSADALAPGSFGAATLALTLISFCASWLKAVFFANHIALTGLFIFLGKWCFDAVYVVLGGGVRGVDLVVQLLLWTPLAAALTAAVAVLLLTIFRPLYRSQAA
ncbi:MAG TPA: rod shape-determining protein MreD [Gemmatimonas sp.]|nr:rod shape-determining protein MreD [Gemmatimonas sp.]